MTNAAIIARLQAMGPLPSDNSQQINTYPLSEFTNLLQQLTDPLTAEQALALLNLGPPPDTSSYEVEWSLIHTAESISVSDLHRILLLAADTEVTRVVALRLANFEAHQRASVP